MSRVKDLDPRTGPKRHDDARSRDEDERAERQETDSHQPRLRSQPGR